MRSLEDGGEDAAVVLVDEAEFPDVIVGLVQHVAVEHLVRLLFLHPLQLFLVLLLNSRSRFLVLHFHHGHLFPLAGGVRSGGNGEFQGPELFDGGDAVGGEDVGEGHVVEERFDVGGGVVDLAKVSDDGDKVVILFLHLLVVAAALFGLSRSHEQLHRLEDLVHATHMPVYEVPVVDLQEPVVTLVLLRRPVPPVYRRPPLLRPPTTAPTPASCPRTHTHHPSHLELRRRVQAVGEVQVRVEGLRRGGGGEGVRRLVQVFLLLVLLEGVEGEGVHACGIDWNL